MKNLWGYMGLMMTVSASVMAQEMPLWRLENHTPPQDIPSYAGGLSPFALSAPQKVMTADTDTDGNEATRAAQRDALFKQATELSRPQRALTPRLVSSAKALTNGGKGLRVLIGGEWLGVGDSLPVRYDVNAEARNALIELQRIDDAAARNLADRLEKTAQSYNQKPNTLKAIDAAKRQILLNSALGELTIPLNIIK